MFITWEWEILDTPVLWGLQICACYLSKGETSQFTTTQNKWQLYFYLSLIFSVSESAANLTENLKQIYQILTRTLSVDSVPMTAQNSPKLAAHALRT